MRQRNRPAAALVFGIAVVPLLRTYAEGVTNGVVQPGFVQFLARYYTAAAWPEHAFAGWQHGYTWNHLWYLAYLWCYTLLLALLQPALASRRLSDRRRRPHGPARRTAVAAARAAPAAVHRGAATAFPRHQRSSP
ncbi:MAG: hypothetical protein IPG23_12405 [Burkholderiales bacterium]|nr:hypothetical protein [Burkholderiales bacterium]